MKVAILGSGESAIGAALLATKYGYSVFVSDLGSISEETKQIFDHHSIHFEESGHSIDKIEQADLVVKSPGIPNSSDLITALKANAKEVIGEIEFGYRHSKGKIIAITGSNGKSTVTNMVYQILQRDGRQVAVGGNFGTAYCKLLYDDTDADFFVLELSSFQLEDISTFRPDVSVILNITSDHLDRYQYDINLYADAKMRITENQIMENTTVFNGSDQLIKERLSSNIAVQTVSVGFDDCDEVFGNLFPEVVVPVPGKHNIFNALIAATASMRLGVSPQICGVALGSYQSLPHRMEVVAQVDGVTYINDSKATNVDAVYFALNGITSPIIWIVGGVDKGNDYSMLDSAVVQGVKAIICMGTDNSKLMDFYADSGKPLYDCKSLESAMSTAREESISGDTVLLSPACASFDLFDNYIHRGILFKSSVLQMIYNNRKEDNV